MWIRRACLTFQKARIPAIGKPATALVAGLFGVLPTQAIAESRDCLALSAIASGAKSEIRNLAVEVNRDELVDLTYRGKTGVIRGADGCGIIPKRSNFEIRCEWHFDGDQSRASALYSAYRIGIKECLAAPFLPKDETGYGKTTILGYYEAKIEHSDETETLIALEFRESKYGSTPKYSVEFQVERD